MILICQDGIYDSNQKNIGFTLDVALEGAGSSLSVNGGKTDINADYKAVGQQSGIFTGDGGFDLTVDGKTDLIGGAITTTDKALELGLNKYISKGGITTRDIENTSSYDGDAISVGISLGMTDNKPQGNTNGLDYGTDSDSDSSTTRAGITGIAGNSGITTDNREEYAGALENGFDATRVNEELGAQTQITQAFDQERRKIKVELNKDEQELRDAAKAAEAVGDTKTRDEYLVQADKIQNQALAFDSITGALYGPNANGAIGYMAKAVSPYIANEIGTYFKVNEIVNSIDGGNRAEQGSAAHLLAHTILGAAVSYATGNDAVTGGVSAAAGEAAAPLLMKYLYDTKDSSELTAEQKDTISSITSLTGTVIGATTGNVNDAVNAGETAKVAVEDNYYYANLKDIKNKTAKQVETIYNINKSSFEGKCRSAGGDCNDVIEKMIEFSLNPYVKNNYSQLRKETLKKLNSNPDLVTTYLDSEFYKLNSKDQSVINTHLKPLIDIAGGGLGVVGATGGTAYACVQTIGLGCYGAVLLGAAGTTSSFDHVKTGLNNYGKPLSQQTTGEMINNLKRLGLSDAAAQNLRLAIDILGTGGVGYSVGVKTAVKTGSYATSTTQSAQKIVPEVRYNNPQIYREELARQAGIPRGIERNPEVLWGKKVDDIKRSFEMDGATVTRKPQRGESNAIVYEVKGGASGIKEFEYHPGGGTHTGRGVKYYKIVKTDGTEVRIFDPSKPFNSGTITPKQKYLDPQGNEYIKRNGQWIKK